MILVTGVTGFLGTRLIKKIPPKKGIRCLLKDAYKREELEKDGFETVICDLSKDTNNLDIAMKNVTLLIHSAALIRGTKKQYEQVNVKGTKNLVDACKRAGVKHIIYISTFIACEGYDGFYGATKREGEEIVKESGINYTILRLGILYDRNRNNNTTAEKMANLVRKLPVLLTFGKGDSNTHLVFVGDVTDAIVAAIGNRNAVNKTYYLVGEKLTFDELFRLFAGRMNKRIRIVHLPLLILKIAFLVYKLTLAPYITLPVHLDSLIVSKDFDTTDAEKDLGFSKSSKSKVLEIVS